MWPAHEPGVLLKLHRRHEPGLGEARTSASALLVMTEHSGTHIDALCHQAENMELHGGVAVDPSVQTPEGFTAARRRHDRAPFARGVLLDCADAGHAVGAEHLERAAEGLKEIDPGDAILMRTGTGALWEDRGAFLAAGGIDASGSRWCAERKPLAVGADNIAWDVPGAVDPELGSLPGHLLLRPRGHLHPRGA